MTLTTRLSDRSCALSAAPVRPATVDKAPGLITRQAMIPPSHEGLVDRLGTDGRTRRILYVPGPGDVAGTYRHWRAGCEDPSIPSIAYSAQVYEFAARIGAQLTVLTEGPLGDSPDAPGDAVRFRALNPPGGHGAGYHLSEIALGLGIVARALLGRAGTIVVQRSLVHLWPVALARLFGIQVVYSLHNTLWPVGRAPSRRTRLINRLNGWAFRVAARVIGVSQAIRSQVEAVAGPGFDRADVQVPQYHDVWARDPAPRPKDRPLRQLLVLGRIEENKGVFLALDAFARIARDHPELRLRIVGEGGARPELVARAAALPPDLAARVEIPGPVRGVDVFAELAGSDLLICPTTGAFAEGLAKTPIEAALMGVPSLVTDVVPAPELLGGAAGVVPAGDVAALAAAVDGLARDPVRLAAMSRAALAARAPFFRRALSLGAQLTIALAGIPAAGRRAPAALELPKAPVLGA